MTDHARPDDWLVVAIAALERDPAAGAAMSPPSPTTADLVGQFPELGSVEVATHVIDGPHGAIEARSYRRQGDRARSGLVWVHGGAFLFGDLDMPEANWVGLALAARGVPVLSVEYRKAVGAHHYPVPSDDVLAAWRWARRHASELGIDVERMHLGGASAGGNLAAGVAKRLRDVGEPPPASSVLVYPVLHAPLPPAGDDIRAALAAAPGAMVLSDEQMHLINLQYAGSEDRLVDPYAFPANGDLAGLAPVFVLNADADLLRASGEAFGEQLAAAGVHVRVEFEPGSAHGHLNEPTTTHARRSLERIVGWIHSFEGEAGAHVQRFGSHDLTNLPAGTELHGVTASVGLVAGRAAVRVDLTDEVRAGEYGIDFVDEPTFVLLSERFTNGSITVDLLGRLRPDAPDYARGFIGLAYRVRSDDMGRPTFEAVYVRPLNGRVYAPPPPRAERAVQYFAYPDWKFDRLRDEEPDRGWEAGADIATDRWASLRLDIDGTRLSVTVDDLQVLEIVQTKGAVAAGRIGLWVDIGTEGYFSNLRIAATDGRETSPA